MIFKEKWIYNVILLLLVLLTFGSCTYGFKKEARKKFYSENYNSEYCKNVEVWKKHIKVQCPKEVNCKDSKGHE